EKLERELETLRQEVRGGRPPAGEFSEAKTKRLKEPAARPGTGIRAGLDMRLYGYVKLDAAYDDSRVSVGNFARWVESESVLRDDEHFNMTVNQTRLGLEITGPGSETFRSGGKVEVDFYGAGAGENRPEPMLRLAYVQLDWLKSGWQVLAGQAADIISPLAPTTVNYSVGWWQGNIGYRRPQLRVTKTIPVTDTVSMKCEAGMLRTITGRKFVFKEATDPDTGADAGFPTVAGRWSMSANVSDAGTATLGVSAHYGQEEQHRADLSGVLKYDTWSVNVDLRVPITRWLLVQGEAFIGEDLDSYLGGIGQGVNLTTEVEIHSWGGWGALTLTPHSSWQFNAGGGLDNPCNRDVPNAGRTANWFVLGNVFYTVTSELQLAFEVMH
ncbi:MAG: hypothetical protein N3A53_08875, partial [Verrucomicrobiae bacterium]|nr:hypothetical protein [Verrucomicrobiae bacterium]